MADLETHQLRLELQGVSLTSVPIGEARLNRHARRLLSGEKRIEFLQSPFELKEDRWFEAARTLAVKDTAAVRDRPDTTGALMEAIRSSPVTALLDYDRRLTMVLRGSPPRGAGGRIWNGLVGWLRSWSGGTLEGVLRRQSSEEAMVTVSMAPADVRSLAPSVLPGTKLILVY